MWHSVHPVTHFGSTWDVRSYPLTWTTRSHSNHGHLIIPMMDVFLKGTTVSLITSSPVHFASHGHILLDLLPSPYKTQQNSPQGGPWPRRGRSEQLGASPDGCTSCGGAAAELCPVCPPVRPSNDQLISVVEVLKPNNWLWDINDHLGVLIDWI